MDTSAAAVTKLRRVRDRLLTDGSMLSQADGRPRRLFPTAIGEQEGRALCEWVKREGAVNTLETGLGFAISTLFICEGLLANGSEGRHVACDPFQFKTLPTHTATFEGVGLQILEDAGVRDLVEFYEEESQVVLPRFLAEGRRFDLTFVDGNHRFEGVFLDLIYVGRLLREGGIVFVDDVQLPGIRAAVDFCLRNLQWTREDGGEEGPEHEWIVLRTGPREVYERPFRDFVPF